MKVWEKAVELLVDETPSQTIYISDNDDNLGRVFEYAKEHCDVAASDNSFTLVVPHRLAFVKGVITNVFYDVGSTNEANIRAYVMLAPEHTLTLVNKDTQEIE